VRRLGGLVPVVAASLLVAACRGRALPPISQGAPDAGPDAAADVPIDAIAETGNADADAGPHCVNLRCRQASCALQTACPPCVGGPGVACKVPPCLPGPVLPIAGCLQDPCPDGGATTVTGRVFDPAGAVPLYNVSVYVPNAPLDPVVEGPSCPRCDSAPSGDPLTSALTDTDGRFTLRDVPVGDGVPIVLELGTWRRELTLPHVAACTETRLPDDATLRLPRNAAEGHLPRVAVTTGAGDALECFLRRVGIDDAEFTPESGAGRVNLYAGAGGTDRYRADLNGGAAFTAAPAWWESLADLQRYDLVLHSCDEVTDAGAETAAARQALDDYAGGGGRVFLTHAHVRWLEHGTPGFQSVAVFHAPAGLPDPFAASVDVTFPKGAALADWLLENGASSARAALDVHAAFDDVRATAPAEAQRWLYGAAPAADGASTLPTVQVMSFQAPVGAEPALQCGRVVFADLHVAAPDRSAPDRPFPSGCGAGPLSPQERLMEFLLFDHSACVVADSPLQSR
jgi:hypothetical protein